MQEKKGGRSYDLLGKVLLGRDKIKIFCPVLGRTEATSLPEMAHEIAFIV